MSATLLCMRCKHPSHEHDWTGDCHVMTEPTLRCFCTQFLRESLDEFYANATERPSETPAQSSEARRGVEGAHEGTTADKSRAARCHVCGCDVWKNGACASCGEPEKLNNAPDPLDYFLVTYGFDGNNHARQMLISCWAAARQYERKQAAESSLSSPSGKVINVSPEGPK